MNKEGGIYHDTDTHVKQLGIIEAEYGFAYYSDEGGINNAVLASIADHQILKIALERIVNNYQQVIDRVGKGEIADCLAHDARDDITEAMKKFSSESDFWQKKLQRSTREHPFRIRQFLTVAMTGPLLIGVSIANYITNLRPDIALKMSRTRFNVFECPPQFSHLRISFQDLEEHLIKYKFTCPEFMKSYGLSPNDGLEQFQKLSGYGKGKLLFCRLTIDIGLLGEIGFAFPAGLVSHDSDLTWYKINPN